MRTGDFVTISNRTEDLPAWFTLHPTEVCNRLSYEMTMKLRNGYNPGTPIEGPNIWRPKSGDRIAWIGKKRPGMIQQGPVLSIIDFRECALVVGESVRALSMDEFATYGSLSKPKQTPEELAACNEAVKIARQMGVPRTFSPEWKLG